jgi:RNA 2',3'-cyclic 3'-phosphodiesterase
MSSEISALICFFSSAIICAMQLLFKLQCNMRAFIAIELPQETKDAIGKLQAVLKQAGADVKWVKPENIHLTLKFLGEVADNKIIEVVNILEESVKGSEGFYIRPCSIGAFPKIPSPKVIWIGIDKGGSQTKLIAQELEERLAQTGIPKEGRPFSSHITIGRTRSFLKCDKLIRELINLEANFEGRLQEFPAAKLTLFKSTLTPQGPVYEAVSSTKLKNAAGSR